MERDEPGCIGILWGVLLGLLFWLAICGCLGLAVPS